MLHYSCDLCGASINDRRYVVKLETYPAFDPAELTAEDLEGDNLQEVAEFLNNLAEEGDDTLDEVQARSMRYDLCPACHARFTKDPLGRDTLRRHFFSEN